MARHAPRDWQTLTLEGLPTRLLFCDAGPVIAALRGILRGWALVAGRIPAPEADLVVARDGESFVVADRTTNAAQEQLSAVAAACSLMVAAVERLAAERNALCLHAGAFEAGGRLVVLAGEARAGKSTLTAALAACGMPIFGDDMLPVIGGRGMALGLAPRLRLPLPASIGPALHAFVGAHAGPSDQRYRYLDLPQSVPHGETAPLGAIVRLERRGRARARLRHEHAAEAVSTLIRRNFIRDGEASRLLDRLLALADGLPCYRLTYADPEEAAALLADGFADWSALPSVDPAPPRQQSRRRSPPSRPAQRYARAPGITERSHDDRCWLAHDDVGAIIELNAVGRAVWALLDVPSTARELGEDIAEATGTDPARVVMDVERLLEALERAGYVRALPDRPAVAVEEIRPALGNAQ